MLRRITVYVLLVVFGGSAIAPAKCAPPYKRLSKNAKKDALNGVEVAAAPAGLLIGSANDIFITLMGASSGFLPPGLATALPLTNEIANIAATSTGRRWLYDGVSKALADNVALGAVLGQTLSMGVLHGPLSGAITLAAGVGLAYWIPLQFLHPVMVGVPKAIPARFKKTRAFAESGPGQAFIGISFVGVLETLLSQAHQLAEKASWNTQDDDNKKKKAKKSPEEEVNQATALFLIDGFLFDKAKMSSEQRDRALIYLSGMTRNGGAFTATSRNGIKKPSVTLDKAKVLALGRYLEKPSVKPLLTDEQRNEIKWRAASLAGGAI